MSFVNPLFLAGAALVAVPIVLHLIMRQKPRHFEFPALRFVRKRHEVNQRRLRLRHLLLLLLRMAALALLAFALARPSIKFSGAAFGSQAGPVAAALIFDTSMRMEYRHQNRTRLDVAREMGLKLLAQLPPESQVAVLDARKSSATFQVDRGAAKHRIERLESAAQSQSLIDVLDGAMALLAESALDRREVYVFTDLTRAAWPSDAASRLEAQISKAQDIGVYLIDVGVADPVDTALGELQLDAQVLSNRSPLGLRTAVMQTGGTGRRSVELYLLDDRRQAQKAGERAVAVDAGQSQEVAFELRNLEKGTRQGYVQLVGEDGLAANDRRFFTVEVKPPWRILLAAPAPADQNALFLSEALAPREFRQAGIARFECQVVGLDRLAAQALDSFAAVCLLDPAGLDASVWQKLVNYAAEGHGVAVFLGDRARPLDSFNSAVAQQLLPARLVRQARAPDGVALSPRDLQHPVLAAFRGMEGTVPWDASPVFRYWQVKAGASGVHVILPYADGQPAILERPVRKGRVLMMTTPVSLQDSSRPWNLLPVGDLWPFVILVNGMASYLVGAGEQQFNYMAGQSVVLALDPKLDYRSYILTALDDPDAPEVRLTPDLKQHQLVVTSTDRLGNFRVGAGGAAGVDRGFSVNLASAETDLTRVSQDDLDRLFGELPYRIARDHSELEINVATGRVGRDLFPLAILVLALILAAEYVVSNRFYRSEQTQTT